MAKIELSEERFTELKTFIENNRSATSGLMPVLHKAQDIFGCIPLKVQKFISKEMDVPVSEIYGVVTFYTRFSTEPVGDYLVGVCMGTACYVKGAQKILDRIARELDVKVENTTDDGKFTLTATRCVGACGLAPVVMINDDVYGKLKPDEVTDMLSKYKG
ncbi:NADH-quinone oxidoreductase subunit NuoE family protein [Haloplasma contractile]|uniref:Electron-transferring subunit of iron-only hydrogenase protein n=1 Tax=Haloplasma contractile SSD-17B TaxID=1033810 RepID=U2FIM9_9MOLU|nr:NAD(P)H-dependent oxidoreductase subunit E [Haloplasma contractile]ERJ11094.1 Putative electron-transferring subunit of iron-only hydrogenase protein [Haloplasma contractile SSD-17B]